MSTDLDTEPGPDESATAECRLVHEYFVRAARRWPDRVAVEVPPGRGRSERAHTTYAQLDRQSSVLACRLRTDISGECVVGILLPRDSVHLYSAQLAVLRAGAARPRPPVGKRPQRPRYPTVHMQPMVRRWACATDRKAVHCS